MSKFSRALAARLACAVSLSFALGACGETGEPAAIPPAIPTDRREASESDAARPRPSPVPQARPPSAAPGAVDYGAYCASCHGARGDGDGPLAGALDPRPAKHSDHDAMQALSDEYLFRVIQGGGSAVGKSPLMAPWGGSLSDQQIRDLVAFIRSLSSPTN